MLRGILYLSFAIITTLPVIAQVNNREELEFDTPEKAITYFIEALKENDIGKAFQACAINNPSRNYDMTESVQRINSLNYINNLAPSEYDAYIELNKIECMAKLARQIKLFYYSMSSPDIDFQRLKSPVSAEELSEFIEVSDPEKIRDLKIVSIDKHDLVDSDRYKRMALNQSHVLGADDGTERLTLMELDSNFYILGFHLLKYGDFYQIDSLNSNLANTSMYGVEKLEFEEYKKRIQ
jgi:hypothetical protein